MAKRDWKKITGEMKRLVLVSNLPSEMDAHGDMSHVWLTTYVHESESDDDLNKYGRFFMIGGGMFLTHYCEVPQYNTPAKRKEFAAEQARLRERQ